MIQIEDILVSDDMLDEKFVCDLKSCKGVCCIEGESGAPLEEEEVNLIEELLDDIKPFMTDEGKKSVDENGVFSIDQDGDTVTMLNNGKECSFTVFDEKGIAQCAIENAHNAGAIDFKKPISCHLYPVRLVKLSQGEAVNYHKWQICEAACALGEKLKMPVFRFVKDGLIRKYGADWYDILEQAAEVWYKEGHSSISDLSK